MNLAQNVSAQNVSSQNVSAVRQAAGDLRAARGLPRVHRAESRQELEAIYRFRYEVYFREFGRLLGEPDHQRRWVKDHDDELPTTTILYTGTPERITSTVRLRHWQPGQVPEHDVHELSMDRIPELESLATAEIGRLMVRSSRRGRLQVAALVRAAYEILVGEHQCLLVFCYCSPGLAHFYQRIAMRPFGGRMVAAPDGVMVPMVSVTSDVDYYRRVGSYLAPMVERFYGPGKLAPVDLAPFAKIFEDTTLELDTARVRRLCDRYLHVPDRSSSQGLWRSAFFNSLKSTELDDLLSSALVLEVEPDVVVTRRGFCEDELYVVLEGDFGGYGVGDCFGEESLLNADGRRRHTIRSQTAGRLLVIRGRCVQKVLRRRPELAVALRGLPATWRRQPDGDGDALARNLF